MAVLRYWAAARDAAGVAEEEFAAGTLAGVLAAAAAVHGDRLARLVPVCSYLVDGTPVGRRAADEVALTSDAVVEMLPPFAGG